MNKIVQEIRRNVRQAGLVDSNKRLRSLLNPHVFELAIKASQRTGDVKWITMLIEKSFARQDFGSSLVQEGGRKCIAD